MALFSMSSLILCLAKIAACLVGAFDKSSLEYCFQYALHLETPCHPLFCQIQSIYQFINHPLPMGTTY